MFFSGWTNIILRKRVLRVGEEWPWEPEMAMYQRKNFYPIPKPRHLRMVERYVLFDGFDVFDMFIF